MKCCNTARRENSEKKIKKNRERADVYGCTGIEGMGVYLQRIATLV